MDREMTELHAQRAAIYYNSSDYASAIGDFSEAVERQPTNPKFYYGRSAADREKMMALKSKLAFTRER